MLPVLWLHIVTCEACVPCLYHVYPHTVHGTHTSQVTICSHNTDKVFYELYVSTLNQMCNFSEVVAVAPWWWCPCKLKHVGAVLLILKCFNNSPFFNVVCISLKLKCWVQLLIENMQQWNSEGYNLNLINFIVPKIHLNGDDI